MVDQAYMKIKADMQGETAGAAATPKNDGTTPLKDTELPGGLRRMLAGILNTRITKTNV